MSGPPADGGVPPSVTIEVQTPKVDATLDLVQALRNIADNARATAATAGTGAARLSTGADVQLAAIHDLASELATRLTTVQEEMPSLHAAIERAAGNKPA